MLAQGVTTSPSPALRELSIVRVKQSLDVIFVGYPLKEKASVPKPGSQLAFNGRKPWSQLTLNCGKAGVRRVDA